MSPITFEYISKNKYSAFRYKESGFTNPSLTIYSDVGLRFDPSYSGNFLAKNVYICGIAGPQKIFYKTKCLIFSCYRK